MNNTNKGVILALITAVFWGVLAIALKVAVKAVDPYTIVWFRFAFAAVALFIFILFFDRKQLRILIRPPFWLIIASLALSINYIGFMLGVKYTSPSNAQVVIQIGQVLFAISGIVIFKEKVRKRQIIGFIIVILGFVLFYSQQLKSLFFNTDDFNIGVLLTIIAAVTWAIYATIQKKLIYKYPPQTQNLLIFTIPVFLYVPLTDFSSLGSISIGYWGLLIFLGANTLIAYGCMSASLKYLDANKVSAILITNPILTFIIMAILTILNVSWIDGERFTILTWVGAITFIVGAFLVVRSGKK
jgi:drug/metabolite transporter (DMT)-like permease